MGKRRMRAKCEPIYARVRAVVRREGVSNAQLAARTGWSELRVWRLLNGRTKLSADDVAAIMVAVDAEAGEIFERFAP